MWPFSKKPKKAFGADSDDISYHAPGSQGPKTTKGKGRQCPNCNEYKFRRDGAIYRCNNEKCGAVGFYKRPGNTGSGPGKTCPNCHKMRLHDVGRAPMVWWCSSCNLVAVGKERKAFVAEAP